MVIWGVGILRSGLAFLHVLLNTHYVCMYGGCSINELCFLFYQCKGDKDCSLPTNETK